jgi:acyl transferase domain-containing protein
MIGRDPKLPEHDSALLMCSGRDRGDLLARLDRIAGRLASGHSLADEPLSEPDHSQRLAIVAPRDRLAERIALAWSRLRALRRPRLVMRDLGIYFGAELGTGRVAFLFPGEGSQRSGMLCEARARLDIVRDWFDALDETYRRVGEPPPSRLIDPDAHQPDDAPRQLLDIAQGGQLSTVANLAYHEVLVRVGIRPDVVLGHSNGEHAAVIASCMDLERDRELICVWLRTASRAGRAVPSPRLPERMAAVSALPMTTLTAIIDRHGEALFLAMDNSPLQQVIAGSEPAVVAAAAEIAAAGGVCRMLAFPRAYHTPLFAGWAAVLGRAYQELPLGRPRVPIHSCATAAAMPADTTGLRAVMTAQWTSPVRLRKTIDALYEQGVRTFIEVGADNKLTGLVDDCLRGLPHLAAATASAHGDDVAQLKRLVAALHAHGLQVDPIQVDRVLTPPDQNRATQSTRMRPNLAPVAARQAELIADARASLVRVDARIRARRGALVRDPPRSISEQRRLTVRAMPFLADHSFGRCIERPLIVLSFTTSLAFAVEAVRQAMAGTGCLVLQDLRASQWLVLDDGLDLRIDAAETGDGVLVQLGDAALPTAFTAIALLESRAAMSIDLHELRPPRCWSPQSFYDDYAFHGPSFRGLSRVTGVGRGGIQAELRATDLVGLDCARLGVDPALLDCAGQMVAFWLLEHHGLPPTVGVFPYATRHVILHAPPPLSGTLVDCRVRASLDGSSRVSADAVFVASGRPIVSIAGLEMRLVRLPDPIAACLFGRHADLQQLRGSLSRDEIAPSLTDHGGLWARLLAHALLDDAEFADWRRHRDTSLLLDVLTRAPQTGLRPRLTEVADG